MATLPELRALLAAELSAVTGLTVESTPPLDDATPGTGVVFTGPTRPGPRFGRQGRVTLQGVVVTGSEADEAAAEAFVDAWSGPLLLALLGNPGGDFNGLTEHGPADASVEARQLDLSVDGRALYALIVTVTLDVDL